jgi:hypothetical protein
MSSYEYQGQFAGLPAKSPIFYSSLFAFCSLLTTDGFTVCSFFTRLDARVLQPAFIAIAGIEISFIQDLRERHRIELAGGLISW